MCNLPTYSKVISSLQVFYPKVVSILQFPNNLQYNPYASLQLVAIN